MNYTCYRGTVDIDGDLDKAAWASAPQTPRFAESGIGHAGSAVVGRRLSLRRILAGGARRVERKGAARISSFFASVL